jgi:broad specificity phosphatase PhoE
MSRNLLVVRHAPTLHNEAGVFMGQLDEPCRADVLALARARWPAGLQPVSGNLFSSPLIRCTATAAALFPDCPPRLDRRLAERHLGEWAGRSKFEIAQKFPEAFLPDGHLDPRVSPPGGETLVAFATRVNDFLAEQGSPGQGDLFLVTHNGVIRMMRFLLEAQPLLDIFAVAEPHLEARPLACDAAALARAGEKLRKLTDAPTARG